MINDKQTEQFAKLVGEAKHITVVQAENPDGDSLGSSLALESLLSELGKTVTMFCAVEIPRYMRYIDGWSRVTDEAPAETDLFIVVDTSSASLLEKAKQKLDLEPSSLVVIDHHGTTESIDATLVINEPEAVATSQLIFELADHLKWEVTFTAAEAMLASILADTLGLSLPSVGADSLDVVAELHRRQPELTIAAIEQRRRELGRKEIEIITYKGELLQRVEYFFDNQLAIVVIPLEEIKQYSDKYNPSVLVLEELRMAKQVKIGISLKLYDDRITGKLRDVNTGGDICDQIAVEFGGGGHPGSAGFKVNSTDIDAIKKQVVTITGKLLV